MAGLRARHNGICVSQSMAFPHRNSSTDHDVVGIMDDSIHNGLGDRTVTARIGVDALVPPVCLILRTEDHGFTGILSTTRLYNLQKIIGFLRIQASDQPFVYNQKIHLLVCLERLLKVTAASRNTQLVQQFRHTDILDRLEAAAGRVAQCAGNIRFSVAGSAL